MNITLAINFEYKIPKQKKIQQLPTVPHEIIQTQKNSLTLLIAENNWTTWKKKYIPPLSKMNGSNQFEDKVEVEDLELDFPATVAAAADDDSKPQ